MLVICIVSILLHMVAAEGRENDLSPTMTSAGMERLWIFMVV